MILVPQTLANTPAIKSSFDSFGVCHITDVFGSAYIEELGNESDRLWERQSERTEKNLRIGLRQDLQGNTVLDRLDPVLDISATFAALNQNPELLKLAENLLGRKVLAMKEKLVFKRPGTGGFGLHRDANYFSSSGAGGCEIVTIAVVLDDFNSRNGPIQFYPQLRQKNLKAPTGEPRDIDCSEIQNIEPLAPLAKAGEILVFDGLIPHRSDYNHSTMPRRLYMITYIPASYRHGRENYYRQRLIEQRRERQLAEGDDAIFC